MRSTDPKHLAAETAADETARGRLAALLDRDLALLGLAGTGITALAPGARTTADLVAVATEVVGLAERGGLLDALRETLLLAALDRGDEAAARLYGAELRQEEGERSPRLRSPRGTPPLAVPELAGREVVRRAVANDLTREDR